MVCIRQHVVEICSFDAAEHCLMEVVTLSHTQTRIQFLSSAVVGQSSSLSSSLWPSMFGILVLEHVLAARMVLAWQHENVHREIVEQHLWLVLLLHDGATGRLLCYDATDGPTNLFE
jgi:hypothetical protein